MTDLERAQIAGVERALRDAARSSGVMPGDPLSVLIEAFIRAIEYLGIQRAALTTAVHRAEANVGRALREARTTADAERARAQSLRKADSASAVREISQAIIAADAATFRSRVKSFDRRTSVIMVAAVFSAGAVSFGAGWHMHERATQAEIVQTEEGLRLAFQRGRKEARSWQALMQWNSVLLALETCALPGGTQQRDGRRFCKLPFWIEAAHPPEP